MGLFGFGKKKDAEEKNVKYTMEYKSGNPFIPRPTNINIKVFKDKIEIEPNKLGVTYIKFDRLTYTKENIENIEFDRKSNVILLAVNINGLKCEMVLKPASDFLKDQIITQFISSIQLIKIGATN